MSAQDRRSLKGYFQAGTRPTADHFAALIDSALIMQDEGFRKTPEHGLMIETKTETLLSFWKGGSRLYALSFVNDPDGAAAPNLASTRLSLDGGLTIAPAHRGQAPLDVRGYICADGRMGRPWKAASAQAAPTADGKWHAITPILRGCHAFEVMAGVGVHDTARFALVHAIAMNTFNPAWFDDPLGLKKRIRRHGAFYRRFGDRLDLRWAPSDPTATDASQKYGRDGKYQLEIRTRTSYPQTEDGGYPPIKVFVTRLWFDSMAPDTDLADGGSGLP
jgi:hypothetical protein